MKRSAGQVSVLAAMAAALGLAGGARATVSGADGTNVPTAIRPFVPRRPNRVKPRDHFAHGTPSRRSLRLRGISRGRRRAAKRRNRCPR